MPAEGLECRSETTESGVMHIEDAEIVKEYAMKVPRKTAVEGLELVSFKTDHDAVDEPLRLIMSTGNFGGSLNVLELNANGDEWNLRSQTQIDSQYFGMGVTTVDTDTYMLTWKA